MKRGLNKMLASINWGKQWIVKSEKLKVKSILNIIDFIDFYTPLPLNRLIINYLITQSPHHLLSL
jgi:hypothetical protein